MDLENSGHTSGPEPVNGSMIRVFGTTGVDGPDGPTSIGGPRQRRLLGLLAIRAGVVVDIDWLSEYLWRDEDRPDVTDRAIRTYVSRLRQALPAAAQAWIETVPSGYQLVAPPEAVDHLRFASLRVAATHARDMDDPQRALTLLDEALELWRGEPFRELDDLDWARAEIEQLRLERLEVLEERWEAALALGRHTQITGELAAFTAEHRHRDRAARQYALALHRSGRTAEALRVIADFRHRLAEESGLDPSPAMVQLQADLLADEPTLRVERIGRPLRGYRLLEEAGSGAFSVVWRGEQPSVQREVAIKQIRAELASQPEFIRRFEAEAHLVARLEHPHIVPLIDYWRDPDSAYLVMRWLPGGTLERRLDDGPLTLDGTRALARQIGGALSAAHARGIVHRDVKTANILFDDDGNAFLGDFGIALEATASDGPEAALSPGSPLYASPEQLRREPLGPEADVFSFGIVLYECLTGTLPFPAGTSAEARLATPTDTMVSTLARQHDAVPPIVTEALAIATAHDPHDRFTSVAALLDAFDVPDAPAKSTLVPAASDLSNPYVGLRAFDDGDSHRFFGRDRLVTDIIGRLAGDGTPSRCVMVVGPSGSGKSSVVRAGVIPALRGNAVPGAADWFVTTMVPGNDPFESLEAALLRIAVNPPPTLLDQLRDGPRGILRGVRRCLGSDDDHLLLFADQFEELFAAAPDVVDDFLHGLAVAIEDPKSPLRFIATLRADFYDRPLSHTAFAPLLAAGAVDVLPLAADELERSITEPAALVGARFEPGLVARIAAEAVTQPAPLPLLQYTLSELFDHRSATEPTLTNESYDELGGVAGAVAARAEALYDASNATERDAIRRVFGRLADPRADSIDLRRRVPVADFADDPAARAVVEQFAAARLVTLDRDVATREPTVEVAHEALFRGWPRLAGWLDEDREVLRATNVIAAAATEWDTGGRSDADLYRGERLAGAIELGAAARQRLRPVDNEFVDASERASEERGRAERTRIRRLRRLVAGTAAALVVALIAGGIAWRQQARANDQADAAEVATLISRSASLQDDDRTQSLLLALEAHRRSPDSATDFAVLDALSRDASASVTPSVTLDLAGLDGCCEPIVSADGRRAFQVVDGRLVIYDFDEGTTVDAGAGPLQSPDGWYQWVADADRRIVTSGLTTFSIEPEDGSADVPITMNRRMALASPEISGDRIIFVDVDRGSFVVVDALDGELVAEVDDVSYPGSPIVTPTFGADGTLLGLGRALPDGSGEVVLLDTETGAEVRRIAIAAPATNSVFDHDAGHLLLPTVDNELITVDLESGGVVATVPTTGTTPARAVGVRPDGLVVIATEGQIELVDRNTGPTGDVVSVRDVRRMRVRPDGSVLKIGNDARSEIIDLGTRSPIAQQRWDIDDGSLVNMRHGRAASVDPTTGHIEVVDLTTGERDELTLVRPDGTTPPVVAAIPDSTGGIWTFTGIGAMAARWDSDGQLIDELSMGSRDTFFSAGGFVGEERGISIIERDDETTEVSLFAIGNDLEVLLRLDAPDVASAFPAPDDGVYLIDPSGMFRSYDSSGAVIDEIDLGVTDLFVNERDESSGLLALAGPRTGVIIDPATGAVDEFPTNGLPSSIDLIDGGRLLVISGADGTVSIWDVERNAPGGTIWNGSGSRGQGGSYFDEANGLLWIASSGELVGLEMTPERWIELACTDAGRDLTDEEWSRLVPGDGPARSACS